MKDNTIRLMRRRMRGAAAAAVLLIFLFSLWPADSHAESLTYTDEKGTEFEYFVRTAQSRNEITISAIRNIPEDGHIVIPQSINGDAVINIGNNKSLFTNAEKGLVKEVTISHGAERIESLAFLECTALRDIDIPGSVIVIASQAFQDCTGMEDLHLNEGTEVIGGNTFRGCVSLTEVAMPKSLRQIEGNSFSKCTGLKGFSVDSGSTSFAATDGVLFSKDLKTLVIYPLGKEGSSYEVPAGTEIIGWSAFSWAPLSSVVLKPGVKSIGIQSFYGCSALESVTLGQGLETIGKDAFAYCESLGSIEIPQGTRQIDEGAFEYSKNLTTVSLPESLSVMGTKVFAYTNVDQRITLPSGITSIPDGTFKWCRNLKHFVVSDSIESIGKNAFEWAALTDVYIPENVKTIANNAFKDVNGLKIVTPSGSDAAAYAESVSIAAVDITLEEYINVMNGEELQDPGSTSGDHGSGGSGENQGSGNSGENQGGNGDDSQSGQGGTDDNGDQGSSNGSGAAKTAAAQTQVQSVAQVSSTVSLARPKLKAKNKKGRKIKMSWNRVKGADGYMLFVKCPGDTDYICRITRGARVKSITHKGLLKGKKYRYRIVPFKIVNGQKIQGTPSKTRTVKVKR